MTDRPAIDHRAIDHRAIDLWVNVNMGNVNMGDVHKGDGIPAEYLQRVKEDYFKGGDDFFRSLTIDEAIDEMDEAGVERAVISTSVKNPEPRVLEFVTERPDRFSLAAYVRPQKLMRELWLLEDLVAEYPVTMARVVPFDIDVPPSDAIYYPLYAKCVEMDLPVSINTGLPGPPVPGECQDPIHLDRVCYRFPDLRICMAHGADPWWGTAMRLMIKYANLSIMTSAYSPRHFPAEFVQFMNTRGSHKVMFASDHPVLPMKRVIDEAEQLDLRDGVLERFLRTNAEEFFFRERRPPRG